MIGNHLFYIDMLLLSVCAIIFSLASYVAGVCVFNFHSENAYRKAFFNVVFGVLLILDLYSCVCTGFKTVNTCSLAVLVYLSYDNKQFFNLKNIDFKALLPFIYIFPVIFILYGMYILPDSIENDVKFYSKIVYSLSRIGNENFYHFYNLYTDDFQGITPYHYIEFWLASLFHVCTGSLAVISLKYFAYPFFISLIMFGFLCNIKSYKILFLFLFIALSLFPLYRYINFIPIGWDILTDFWLRPNFIPYYFLFALIYNALKDNNYKLFYVFVALGLTFSVILLPVISISLILFTAYLFITKKQSLKQSMINLLPTIFISFGLLLIYKLFGSGINVTTSDINIKKILLYDLKIWKAVIFAIVGLIVEGSIILLISYLGNRLKNEKEHQVRFVLFVFCLLITGVMLFQLLNQLDNSYQFAYFSYSGLGFLFIVLLVDLVDLAKKPVIKICMVSSTVGIVILLSTYSFNRSALFTTLSEANLNNEQVSIQWRNEFKKYIAKNPDSKGSFVFNSMLKESFKPKDRYCVNKQLGSYICYLTDDCNLPSITCRDSLLLGYTEETKSDYIKCISWLDAFPDFTRNCIPESYLASKKFDYFFCDLNYLIKDTTLSVISDSLKHTKLVYRK